MEIIFTKHVLDRIKKRKIAKEEVIDAVKYPQRADKIGSNYHAKKDIGKGKIEVIYEKDKDIKIITV